MCFTAQRIRVGLPSNPLNPVVKTKTDREKSEGCAWNSFAWISVWHRVKFHLSMKENNGHPFCICWKSGFRFPSVLGPQVGQEAKITGLGSKCRWRMWWDDCSRMLFRGSCLHSRKQKRTLGSCFTTKRVFTSKQVSCRVFVYFFVCFRPYSIMLGRRGKPEVQSMLNGAWIVGLGRGA